MKLFYIGVLCLLLAACTKTPQLNLTVKAAAITNGVIILKQHNEIVMTEPVKNGQMTFSRQLVNPGYYSLTIADSGQPINAQTSFDVYLKNGDYTIEQSAANPQLYPKIITASTIQNQLSDYYKMADEQSAALDHQIDSLKTFLESAQAAALPKKERATIYTNTRKLQQQRRALDLKMLRSFTEKYPENKIGAHIMAQQYFVENPEGYNKVFQKFTADIKSSDDGLKISNKLNAMLGVMTNAKAPDLVGNTPDGKPFNKKSFKNKITLIEFWRSTHDVSAHDHLKMVNGLIINDYDRVKFGILSVSIDTSAAQWTKVIQQDHLSWPQVSDLKGDASPNVANWNITKLPAYFLVDKNWHIIQADVELIEVDGLVHAYLQKQR